QPPRPGVEVERPLEVLGLELAAGDPVGQGLSLLLTRGRGGRGGVADVGRPADLVQVLPEDAFLPRVPVRALPLEDADRPEVLPARAIPGGTRRERVGRVNAE